MRDILATLAIVVSFVFPVAAGPDLTENQKKLVMQAMFRLVMADECNKRFDDRELFAAATDDTIASLIDVGMPDAESVVRKAAKDLAEKPQQPSGGFSLASEKMCNKIRQKLNLPAN